MHELSPTLSETKRSRLPMKRFLTFICLVGVLIVSMLTYSSTIGLRMSERYTPLIDATMEIKLEATTAHLWYEEVLNKERLDGLDDIRAHLELADWYALAMLNGGTNSEGTFFPLADPELRMSIQNVRTLLQTFTKLVNMRLKADTPRAPADLHKFHHIFDDLIAQTDAVETRLQQLIGEAQDTFKQVQIALALIAALSTAFVAWVFSRFAMAQNQTLSKLSLEVEQRTKAEETLRLQASTDPLTGLYNRRYITDILQDEARRAKRQSNPFSVMMMDIDHFKAINDSHGHDVGDRVLQAVSSITSKQLREVDVLARWGGEEFLILLRGTNLEGALQAAEKCRSALAEETFEQQGKVTASLGVAQAQDDEGIRDLVHRADKALYAAKTAGRNQVHTA